MNQPIFVTGGTGVLGAYVLHYLVQKGYTNIRALRRENSPMGLVQSIDNQVVWLQGDVLDVPCLEEHLEGVQQVYHCAATVSFDSRDLDQMMKINVEGTANIVNICLHHGIEKLVHVSSTAAIGRRKRLKEISETTKWENSPMNSQYAVSKQQAEMEVWRGIAEGLNAAIVNPGIIVGGGFWEKGSARFFKNIAGGFPFYPVGASGFVDARDVARFMIQLMESEVHSERFLLVGENSSYRRFFQLIAKDLDKKEPRIAASTWLRAVAWRVEWLRSRLLGKRSSITRETAENSARTWVYDSTKSVAAFDFKYTPLEETVKATAQVFLAAEKEGKEGVLLRLNGF